MIRLRTIGIIINVILIVNLCANAQEQYPMRGPAAERVEQFKKIRLMEALKMNEETSIRFFSRYNKHIETMRDIGKNRNDLIDQLQKLNRSNGSDADIDKIIKDIALSEDKVAELRTKFLTELKEVLSVKQIADYIVFERNFNQHLRELMREIARDRWERREEK